VGLDAPEDFAQFNQALTALGIDLTMVAQSDSLLTDGLSYEQRIAEKRQLASRVGSLHDYYSALMWLRFPAVKQAVNALQMAGIVAHGTKQRSSHQQSITHLDEAGAWIACADPALLALIDNHQWRELFFDQRAAWGQQIEARVFGHAIYELLHSPERLLAAKVVWVLVDADFFQQSEAEKDRVLDPIIASALLEKTAAADPKLLSTVPLSGIPGWFANQDAAFYDSAPCFRSKPPERLYSAAIDVRTSKS
jgi:hypothetical protein